MNMTYNYAGDIDRFYGELMAGVLGVAPRPALTMDVFALYRAWATSKGLPVTDAPRVFVTALVERHRVPSARKRFTLGREIGQGSFLFLTSPPPAPMGYEREWMGDHVVAFKADLGAYLARLAAGVRDTARTVPGSVR